MSHTLQNDTSNWPYGGLYLPSYEESMKISQCYDPMRLPNYQSRSLSRYHPYMYFTRDKKNSSEKYLNTIYDDEGIPLELPPSLRRQDASSLASDSNASQTEHPMLPQSAPDDRQVNFERRIIRLSGVMAEFLSAVKRANELYEAACLSASENAETSAEREDMSLKPSSGDV